MQPAVLMTWWWGGSAMLLATGTAAGKLAVRCWGRGSYSSRLGWVSGAGDDNNE
eukprot:SAG22_NODE_724_length_7634_cov_11.669808_6_plen_54_part_00